MRKLCAALVILACLANSVCLTVSAAAIPAGPTPSEYEYEVWLKTPNISLMVPADASYKVYQEDAQASIALVYPPQYADLVTFVFFAIRYEGAENVALDQLEGAALTEFLSTISHAPENLSSKVAQGMSLDRPALEVDEPTEVNTKHLVSVAGDWVLNVMVQRNEGLDPFPEEVLAFQRRLLERIIAMESYPKRTNAYTLPHSSITLQTPPDTYLRLVGEEPDFNQLAVYQPDTSLVALSVFASFDSQLTDQTVESLDEQALIELTSQYSLGEIDPATFQIETDPSYQVPVLSYQTNDLPNRGLSTYKLVIRDGWSVVSMFMPLETLEAEWALDVQTQLTRQVAGGQSEKWDAEAKTRSVIEADRVVVPMQGQFLDVHIPKDFIAEIEKDTQGSRQLSLYDLRDENLMLHVSLFYNAAFAGATIETLGEDTALSLLGEPEAERMEEMGSPASASYQKEGLLGLPCIYITNEAHTAEAYMIIWNSHIITCSLVSYEAPVTPELSEILKNLLALREADE